MNKTNYSYETSLPPYNEQPEVKQIQSDIVYSIVLQQRKTCLKQIEKITGLPQSTVAGRVNGLIEENKVQYTTKAMIEGRLRKIIEPIIIAA